MIYEKITKTQARQRHAEGKTVYCLPCNACPGNMWVETEKIPLDCDFDKYINNYSFYNCRTNYLGKRIAFYKEESRFEPRQRTALDGKVWWVVYDRYKQEFSSLTCFGKYKTKKDCQWAIDYYKEVM